MDPARKARVFLWLAYMAGVEADAIRFRWPPAREAAELDEIESFTRAGDACVARAERELGRDVNDGDWQDAVESFGRAA